VGELPPRAKAPQAKAISLMIGFCALPQSCFAPTGFPIDYDLDVGRDGDGIVMRGAIVMDAAMRPRIFT
jgi:hypothetical protein